MAQNPFHKSPLTAQTRLFTPASVKDDLVGCQLAMVTISGKCHSIRSMARRFRRILLDRRRLLDSDGTTLAPRSLSETRVRAFLRVASPPVDVSRSRHWTNPLGPAPLDLVDALNPSPEAPRYLQDALCRDKPVHLSAQT